MPIENNTTYCETCPQAVDVEDECFIVCGQDGWLHCKKSPCSCIAAPKETNK